MVRRSPIVVVALLICSSAVSACVCGQIEVPIEKARQYYKKSFEGAVFTGKIRSTRDLPPSEEFDSFPVRELLIDVEQFWVGVKGPIVKARTSGPNTSCTVEWEIGRTLFFIASKTKDGLFVGMCDLVNWKGNYPDKEWADYTLQVLGPAKTFPKMK